VSDTPRFDYLPDIEICYEFAKTHRHNCAVRERTRDGVSVGACSHYLKDGMTCPRHGKVKGPVKPAATGGEVKP